MCYNKIVMPKQIERMQEEELYNGLIEIESRIDRDSQRMSRIERGLGRTAVSKQLKDSMIFNTSDTLAGSEVTDSYSATENEHIPEPTIPERVIGNKAIEAMNQRKSISITASSRDKIMKGKDSKTITSELSFLQKRRDIKHAKRLRKQELRQAKSREMERIFGGGIGLGKTSKNRTKLHQHSAIRYTIHRYEKGELTARQLLDEKDQIKAKEKVIIQPVAVRRAHRRERRGAIYNHVRASQPAVTLVNKVKEKILTGRADRVNSRIMDRHEQRQRILEELEKRRKLSN